MNRITNLLGTRFPVIQGGMAWCSGWKFASAVSNSGGLGLLGAGSMTPEVLREHIRKCHQATDHPFGVNVPLQHAEINEIIEILIEERIKIVFTSAGDPREWTGWLKGKGMIVAHVVSSSRQAQKAEKAGVDLIVAEGVEAGGHNGREETTTFCLIPSVRKNSSLPLIAAGGIATGAGFLAAMTLGADGIQIGTRFALTQESSASEVFKRYCLELGEGATRLMFRKLIPVRLAENPFRRQVEEAEARGASEEELLSLLGAGRARMGIFQGDLSEGEIEIGQVATLVDQIQTVEEVMKEIVEGYLEALFKRNEW
ncbi:MAG: nitronate monooxygenase [Bacteroides sp.]|nr:nitronate monooxygenase [Bacteroides sp.]